MANKIIIKRGLKANLGSLTLSPGELGIALDTQELYVGDQNGSVKIIKGGASGSVESADKLTVPRTISLTNDATGSTEFDGSQNVSIAVALANSGVTAGTYTKVTVDAKGRVTTGSNLTIDDLPQISIEDIDGLGTAASKDVGTASGQIPVLDASGKLVASVIPHIAITDTYVVNSESEMVGLNAQVGDVAVRTDVSKSFILTEEPASTVSNWQELLTPESPVESVNGKTGAVVIGIADISGLQEALDSKVTSTGSVTAEHIAVFNDATGKVLKDAGYTVQDLIDMMASGDYNDLSNKPITNVELEEAGNFDDISGEGLFHVFDNQSPMPVHSFVIQNIGAGGTKSQLKIDSHGVQTRYFNSTWTEWEDVGGIEVVDNLTSTSTTSALSANQGKILNETKLGINDTIDGGTF